MATIKTAVDIDVNVQGTQTVQQASQGFDSLKTQFRAAKKEAELLTAQYGLMDERTQAAIRRTGEFKDQMEELGRRIESQKSGMDTHLQAVRGMVGGFEAAAGAAALMGIESENLQKSLLRVQGAMAFAQGIDQFMDFLPAIKNTANAIRLQLVTAFSTLRGAIAATGIGALVIGVGLLIGKMMSLKDATNEASEAQKEYNNRLRDLNIERIALTKGELEAAKVQKQAAIAERDRNNQFIREYNKRVGVLQELKAIGIDAETSIDRERAATAKKLVLRNKELTNDILKFNARIKQIEEQTQNEKNTRQETAVKKTEENLQKEIDLYEWYLGEVKKVFGEIGKGITTTTETTIQATTTQITYAGQATYDQLDRIKLFIKAYSADIAKTIADSLQAGAAIADAFAGADVERQRKAFQLNKAAAIASTTLATIEGTQNAYKTAKANPLDAATFGAYSVTQAAIALAFGLAQVKKIQATQFQSATPGTLGGTGVQQFPAPRAFQASTLGQDFSGQTKVYVTEGDITKTQRRVQNLQRVSVVGG